MQVIAIPEDLSQFSVTRHHFYYTSPTEVQILCWLASLHTGNIVEIGCNLGMTTYDLARLHPDKTVYAIDYLDDSSTLPIEQLKERPDPDLLCRFAKDLPNVKVLNCNSNSLDYSHLKNIQFFFIDGDHSFDSVKEDSTNALFYLHRNGGGIVAWHDYILGSSATGWLGVKRYIDEYIRPIYPDLTWIEHTRIAFLKIPPL